MSLDERYDINILHVIDNSNTNAKTMYTSLNLFEKLKYFFNLSPPQSIYVLYDVECCESKNIPKLQAI